MKLSSFCFPPKWRTLIKTLLIMKFTGILLFAACLQVSATGYSQKITIKERNVTLQKVFKQINRQTGFEFFYKDALLNQAGRIDIVVHDATIEEVLDVCFQNLPLTYTIVDKTIVLKLKEKKAEEIQAPEPLPPIQVSGIVTDDEGNPLSDVSVIVKGTSLGTKTDNNGNFSISVPNEGSILAFSYVGHEAREVKVTNSTSLSITLKRIANISEELVVIGYGTKKKVNLTGAVSTVSSKDIESRPIANTQQAIQGLVTNLNISVSNAGGEPGESMNMNIRGLSTFSGSTSPFVLVDNIPMDINSINPADIESISVLKDAASSAIYGARAAYGVILITTKSGKANKGKSNISYSSNYGFAKPVYWPKLVDAMTFALVANDAAKNVGNSPWYNADALDRLGKNIANPGSAPEMYGNTNGLTWNIGSMGLGAAANTDWYDILFKDYAFRQKHDLSFSGASDKVDYYISAGWWNEQGLLKYGGESYNRYNFDGKVNAQATSWAKVGVLFKYNYGLQEFPWQQELGRGRIYDMITKLKPTMPAKYPGTDIWTQESRIDEWNVERDNTWTTQMVLAPRIVLEPIKGWVTNLEFNYTTNSNRQEFSVGQYFWMQPNGELAAGVAKASTSFRPRISTNNYLSPNLYSTYTRSFDKHNFSLMVGYQQEKYNYFNLNADALYLLSDNVQAVNTAVGTKTVVDGQGHWATRSGFGRLLYDFKDKYLLEVNFRADGSSRFEPGSQWGYFPSVSAGWVASQEKFFPFKDVINFFKLRGSFGQLGNQNVDNYLYIPTLGISQSTFLFSGQRLWSVAAPNISSVDLTWEKVKTIDFGIDLAFLRKRLNTTFDWYQSYTTDLVGPGPALPALLGTSVPRENSGEIRTRGFELEVTWKDRIGDFYYQIGGNLANNKSEVMSYNNPTGILSSYYKGQVLGEIWGYNTAGLFQSTQDVSSWVDQSFLWSGKWNPGDLKYMDLNKDGKVNNGTNTVSNPGDQVIVGNQLPRYTYAININASWKGFDISVFFQGVAKWDMYLSEIFNGNVLRGPSNGPFHMMVYKEHLDYWRDDGSPLGANSGAYFPKPYSVFDGDNSKAFGRPTDRYLQNGAYLRLKNLRLGYTIPAKITNKVLIKNANIYFSGENLFVIKKFDLLDPEQTGGRNGDGRTYPLSKTLSFGLNVNF